MRATRQSGKRAVQRGAALLIAIFALLLISVVAIALIVSSGTDTALASNFRSSTNAYYAAVAGIEEARGRLLPSNANCIPLPPNINCNQQPPATMPLTQVVYIINPSGGETVAPWNTSSATTYPDTEYKQEFGVDVSARLVTAYTSLSPVAGYPGPSYKWVRINATTELALGGGTNGVDVNWDGSIDQFTPLYYDPVNWTSGAPSPGLIENASPPATAGQALEITAYAVLPSGTQKMLQYVVRPLTVFPNISSQSFPAPLTLVGPNVAFTGPQTANGSGGSCTSVSGSMGFNICGQDQCNVAPTLPAIGYTNADNSLANITSGAVPAGNYQGAPVSPGPPVTPSNSPQSIQDVNLAMNPNWLTPGGLDAVVQDITNNADAVIQGPATPASFPSGMSATHPMTIVVQGDLDLTGWHNTGYGLLLVTGTLKYDPDATWEGIVLIIGQGVFVSTRGGVGGVDGAMLIAKTRDASNNLLGALGTPSFSQTGNGNPNANFGKGINFNSCLVQSAQGPLSYKILAFKEIPLS